jgi:autotransporter-associated beta strand protein
MVLCSRGQINEADQTLGTGDVLSIQKVGAGTVTISSPATNYRGTTTVQEGRLQIGNGTSGSILGTGAVTVTGPSLTLTGAPVLAGGSSTSTVAGGTVIGTATNPGILAPGVNGDSALSNQSMTFSSGAGVTVANGSQIQMSITTPTAGASNGTVSGWLSSGQTLSDYLTANPGSETLLNVAPASYGDLDYINLTAGGLVLGDRASGAFGDGSLLVQNNGWTPAVGDMFNLFDWVTAMTGSFDLPGPTTTGGSYGDIDLPTLSGGLNWDVSAFTSHGIIIVGGVPEPGRMMLLLLASSASACAAAGSKRHSFIQQRGRPMRPRPLEARVSERDCVPGRVSGYLHHSSTFVDCVRVLFGYVSVCTTPYPTPCDTFL